MIVLGYNCEICKKYTKKEIEPIDILDRSTHILCNECMEQVCSGKQLDKRGKVTQIIKDKELRYEQGINDS